MGLLVAGDEFTATVTVWQTWISVRPRLQTGWGLCSAWPTCTRHVGIFLPGSMNNSVPPSRRWIYTLRHKSAVPLGSSRRPEIVGYILMVGAAQVWMDDLPKVGTIICSNLVNLVNSCVLPAVVSQILCNRSDAYKLWGRQIHCGRAGIMKHCDGSWCTDMRERHHNYTQLKRQEAESRVSKKSFQKLYLQSCDTQLLFLNRR